MPRALVTGATGLVGSHLVDRLLAEGWSVRALVRSPAPALSARGVECVSGDVLDGVRFAESARGVDVIFHTAAAITPRGGWEAFRGLNVDGTANAIAAAERSGARLLQLSSVAVYGPEARYQDVGGVTSEDTPLAPLPERAFYARSKRESEALVMRAHAEGRIWATAVRPCVIYGPRDRQFVPRIGRLLSHGFAPLIGGGGAVLAVVHAANVADGALRAAAHDGAGGRAYNLANDDPVTVRRFFELAAAGLGRPVRLVPIPRPVARALFSVVRFGMRTLSGGRLSVVSDASLSFLTRDNPFTSERARRELGWRPVVHAAEGVPEAFRWWRQEQRHGEKEKSAT
ncbi:MAG TPA: NAD-dependent epimerase/dehydratase family protein [Gemmatimonadaceae bacterium]|nr:NAD-dependent epimerase/dehydratase family protein [Gemmatimonadaceae bacterium]